MSGLQSSKFYFIDMKTLSGMDATPTRYDKTQAFRGECGGNSVNNQLSFAGVNLIERDKAKGRTAWIQWIQWRLS